MSRPTIAGVAREAGVSVASVSRVLNGLPATDEMIERVQRAVDELGYVPDARARSLNGMARGYADGLVISPLRVDEDLIKSIRECEVPVVVAGSVPAKAGVDTVRANSPKGMLLAVEHLVSRGRRRIAFLNGPADTVPGEARAKGFADALRAHDLQPAAIAEAADFTFAAGRATAPTLLGKQRIDAVIGANDLLAVGLMHELAAAGLQVPGDVAVVGMDDSELAEQCFPPLTSVNLGSAERGRRAAELLLARIEDNSRAPRRIVVQPSLSVRKSTP